MSDRTRHIVTLSLAVVLFVVTMVALGVSAAKADPTPAPPGLSVTKVRPLLDTGLLYVTLSNGKSDSLTPCRFEDGRHCYWLAGVWGNGKGHDFLVTRGHVFYVDGLSELVFFTEEA